MIPGAPDDLANSLILRLLRGVRPNAAAQPVAAPPPQPTQSAIPQPQLQTGQPRLQTQPAEEIPPLDAPPTPKTAFTSSLLKRAEGIQNPIGRVAGTLGAGLLRGLDVAGGALFPGEMSRVPGSTLNTALGNEGRLENYQKQQQLNTQRLSLKPPQEKTQTPEEAFISDYMAKNPGKTMADALQQYTQVTTRAPEKQPKEVKPGEYKQYTVPGAKAPVLAREDEQGNLITRDGQMLPAGATLYEKPDAGAQGTWSLQTVYGPDGKPSAVEVNSKSGAIRPAPTTGTKAKPDDNSAKINSLEQDTTTKITALDQAHQAGKLDDASYADQSIQQWKTYAQSVRRLGQVPTATPDLGALYLRKYGNEAAAEAAMRSDGWQIPQ